MKACAIDDCDREAVARSWCYRHWRRWKTHGDPLYVRPSRVARPRLPGDDRYRARRVATLNEMKLAAGCVDCGYDAHPAALHFDHIDPATKVGNVSYIGRHKSRVMLFAEVLKCDVRCANCHAVRTATAGHAVLRGDPRSL